MKFILAPLVALGLAASGAFAQFTINTPASAVVCQPLLITWSGGVPSYFLSILPGNQPSAAALYSFPSTNATEVTWLVNIAAQTSLGLTIRDSTGAIAQTAAFSVQTGTDTSCIGNSTSVSFGATAAPGTTAAGQSTSIRATTTPGTSTSPQTSAAASRTSTGTTAAASATKSGGASRVTGQIAAAGIIGAAMVALLG